MGGDKRKDIRVGELSKILSSEPMQKIKKTWGYYLVLYERYNYKVKVLVLFPGCKISLQCHAHRHEHWYVVQGKAKATKRSEKIILCPQQFLNIPQYTWHQIENIEKEKLILIEVQTGTYFGEDDIKRKKVVVASGYFNPLHIGHLEYLQLAKDLGDYLVVVVNNDLQVGLKGSTPFMPVEDRIKIVKALQCVNEVFCSIDKDPSVCKSLALLSHRYNDMIFVKGGDRTSLNIPEKVLCDKLGIKIIYGLGDKIRSSSNFVAKWLEEK